MRKTFYYIDGFNFYYRAVKGTPYKWLNFYELFTKVFPSNPPSKIKYFTALVKNNSRDRYKRKRQKNFIKALETYIPNFETYYGTFLKSKTIMPVAEPEKFNDRKWVKVIKQEEKGSDVNLAVHLLNDGWKNLYDIAIVISNDSDLVEAIRLVREELGKIVGIGILPNCNPSVELLKNCDFKKKIRMEAIKKSQLPIKIPGTDIVKPDDW